MHVILWGRAGISPWLVKENKVTMTVESLRAWLSQWQVRGFYTKLDTLEYVMTKASLGGAFDELQNELMTADFEFLRGSGRSLAGIQMKSFDQ